MPVQAAPKLLAWGRDGIDDATIAQAAMTARLPFVPGHVALMPDGHKGIGATVGSVIPTEGAIIPAAVGVDIGCGMIASETSLTADDLPDNLDNLMPHVEKSIPAGVGQGHERGNLKPANLRAYDAIGRPWTELGTKRSATAEEQFGTLGSGNHFAEVCLDERGVVWTVLHSGSRGIGNQLATQHIETAKGLMKKMFVRLEDPALAYLVEGSPEFGAYIEDMLWAQRYAFASRTAMAAALNSALFKLVRKGQVIREINCHHNFTQREIYGERELWITRKGAIQAATGCEGVIPGSMGTRSYIISGLGNAASWNSCSHGAGRRLSRGQAKKELTGASLKKEMKGIAWNSDRAGDLVDEHPKAYKDIDDVMAAQADLCAVQHVLRQVFNYKG